MPRHGLLVQRDNHTPFQDRQNDTDATAFPARGRVDMLLHALLRPRDNVSLKFDFELFLLFFTAFSAVGPCF